MRVATFNIQHGRPAAGGPVDPDLVAATCASLDADVVALQEVDRGVPRSGGHDLAAIAADALGGQLAFGESMSVFGGSYGNALIVRGSIESVEVLHLPSYRWMLKQREPRVALIARVEVDGASATVVATHLGVPLRENGIQLAALLRHLVSHPLRVLLLGDCNRAAPLARPELARAGYDLAGGPATFPALRPLLRIDHVAARGGSVAAVEVVRTPISDHRAVIAEVVFG